MPILSAINFRFFGLPKKRGQATLGFVFLVASIILIVSVSFVFVVISLVNSGFGYQAAQQANMAANSGVEDAFLQLARNKDFSSSGYSFLVSSASAAVSVSQNMPLPGQVTIVSSGIFGSATHRIQAIATVATSTTNINILSWLEVTQ